MDITSYMTGIQHIGLPTNNLTETIAFYVGLGFEVAHKTEAPDGTKVAFLKMKTLMIETYEDHQAALKTGAIAHVAIDVTQIEKIYETLKAGDYKILDDHIMTLPFWEKGVKFFNVEGPNREILEFCEINR